MHPRECRAANGARVVVEAHQGIELMLRGRRVADGCGNLAGIADKIRFETPIALLFRPNGTWTDAGAGLSPADRPGGAPGARIRIGFIEPIGPQTGAGFELLDKLDSRWGNPTGWSTWSTVLREKFTLRFTRADRPIITRQIHGPIDSLIERSDFAVPEAAPEHVPDGVEDDFAFHGHPFHCWKGEGIGQIFWV